MSVCASLVRGSFLWFDPIRLLFQTRVFGHFCVEGDSLKWLQSDRTMQSVCVLVWTFALAVTSTASLALHRVSSAKAGDCPRSSVEVG